MWSGHATPKMTDMGLNFNFTNCFIIWLQIYLWDPNVGGHMWSPAWSHSHYEVPLCSWMSTCLSVALPFWACLPACGHLLTSSTISRHGCSPHYYNHQTPPSLARPLQPFLVFPPQTPAVNHLCLSCSPPHSILPYCQPAHPLLLYILLCATHRHVTKGLNMHICIYRRSRRKPDMRSLDFVLNIKS